MKKHTNLWLVLFLAISLALSTYSMAQSQTKLTLESSSGDRIVTQGIKSFARGTDDNLVIYLDQPFNFVNLLPDISVDDTPGTHPNCDVTKPATVTATQPAAGSAYTITFNVASTTSGTSFTMPVGPEPIASFNTNTFGWNIGGSLPVAVGSYLAVFEGTSGANKSQLVVMINILPPGYTLTITTQGSGSVTKNPSKATYDLNPPETVQLTANPGAGYNFTGWTGDLTGAANPANITMNSNKAVTAIFAVIPTSTLQVNSSDSGVAITVSPADNNGQANGSAPFTRTYNQTTTVTLTAPSTYNSKNFNGWAGADSHSGNQATVIMPSTGTKTVAVSYTVIPTSTLQVNSSDSGVTITVSPTDNNGQANGSAPFTRTYSQNAVVTLTAPSTYNGKSFSGWTGADSTTGTQATVTIPSTGTKTVTVNFAAQVQGQVLPWNQNHIVIQFAPNETKTLIARVTTKGGAYAKAFQLAFITMGLTIKDGSFQIPLKPDGSSYTTFNGKNEITGFQASNEGGITLNVGYGNIILNSTYIYPGDFILTLTTDAHGGWGYMSTSVYY